MDNETEINGLVERYTPAELWEMKVELERKLLDPDKELSIAEVKALAFQKRIVSKAYLMKSQLSSQNEM